MAGQIETFEIFGSITPGKLGTGAGERVARVEIEHRSDVVVRSGTRRQQIDSHFEDFNAAIIPLGAGYRVRLAVGYQKSSAT